MKKKPSSPKPPRLGRFMLKNIIRPEIAEYLEGDLEEIFYRKYQTHGLLKARLRYLFEILLLLRPKLIRKPFKTHSFIHFPMNPIRQTLLSVLRRAKKQPFTAGIQLLGLMISFVCAILIGLHVVFHFSFDQSIPNADQTYRVVVDRNYVKGETLSYATTPFPLAEAIEQEFSAVKRSTQIFSSHLIQEQAMLTVNDQPYYEDRLFFVEKNMPSFFGLEFVRKDIGNDFDGYTALLSESTAEKYFARENPLGKTILLGDSIAVTVKGVYKDMPANAHLHLPMLLSMDVLDAVVGILSTYWGWDLAYTYIQLSENAEPEQLAAQFDKIFDKYTADYAERRGYTYSASLQPLTDIHLKSDRLWELFPGENLNNLYLLSFVSVLMLAIAMVNYINLFTAQVFRQVKAIGMRKILGAGPLSLLFQFLTEISMQIILVWILSWGIVYYWVPKLSSFTDITTDAYFGKPMFVVWTGSILMGIIIILFVSVYIFFLVRPVNPRVLLNRHAASTYRLGTFSKCLLVCQFAVAIFLTLGTTTIYQQIKLLQSHALGFNKDHVLVFSLNDAELAQIDALKHALLNKTYIHAVSATSAYPGGRSERMRMRAIGSPEFVPVNLLWVDHDFVKTLEIPLIEGRDFSKEYSTDENMAFLVNKAALKAFGLHPDEQPEIEWPTALGLFKGKIVGVMDDFHFASLHQNIEPLVLTIDTRYNYLLVRIDGQDVQEAIAYVEEVFQSIIPEQLFHYQWLDQSLANQYNKERKISQLLQGFTFLAFIIAIVGLIALTEVLIENRIKEMGIRKVLGASVIQILVLVNKQFIYLLILALVIAIPVSLWFLNGWLEQYVYRVAIGLPMILLICAISLILILATISLKSLKAALENPVKALRNE